MNTQAGDFYLSNEDADRIAASAGLSATEYDALAKAASLEQQQRNQDAVQKDIDNKMQILASLNAASRRAYKPAPVGFVPMGMTPVEEQVRVPVPASERLGYATKARELQQEIQRNLSEAGMIQGPAITGPLTPTPPVGSEQPKSEAPAQPSANAPAPTQEQKQTGQFSEFASFIKKRDETRARAIDYVKNNFPREDWVDGLEMVQKMTEKYFPAPRNIAQPIIDQFTGKPLEGYALIGGKVEKIDSQKKQAALTQEQSQSLQFGRAMESSSKRLSELMGKTGYNPASAIERLPALEMFKGEPRKLYENIVTDFALAYNRKTSGASITPREFEVVEKLFFPAIGDTPEVIKAKEQNRKREIESLFQAVPEWARTSSEQQQQQSAPGGVVEFMRAPGKGGIIKK